jgi:hypothetical protein
MRLFAFIILFMLNHACGSQEPQCEIYLGNHSAKATVDGFIVRNYRFTFRTDLYTAIFTIPIDYLNSLDQYGQAARRNIAMFAKIAALEMFMVSQAIKPHVSNKNEAAEFALALCHGLPYATDEESVGVGEFYRFPVESLVDTRVDCEDTSFIFAGILDGLEVPYVFLSPPNHLAVGVVGDYRGCFAQVGTTRFFFAETTGLTSRIGEYEWDARDIELIDVSGEVEVFYKASIQCLGQLEPLVHTAVRPAPIRPPPRKQDVTKQASARPAGTRSASSGALASWIIWGIFVVFIVFFVGNFTQRRAPASDDAPWEDETEHFASMTEEEIFEEEFENDRMDL